MAALFECRVLILVDPFSPPVRAYNFNAGFCLAQVLGLDPQASLIAGVGTSGFYVRNRRSPSISELADFLREWSKHGHEEF